MTNRTVLLVLFAALGVAAAVFALTRDQPTSRGAAAPVSLAPTPAVQAPVRTEPPARSAPLPVRPGASDPDVVGSLDPGAKNYDPVKVLLATHATPAEIFQREPRDPAFAGPREVALRERLLARLHKRLDRDVNVEVSCRTSACDVSLRRVDGKGDLASALPALAIDQLAHAAQVGTLDDPGAEGAAGASIVLLFSAAERDPATYDAMLHQHEAGDEPTAPHP